MVGEAVSIFPDLSVIPLKKRKNFQFLKEELWKNISYRWGFTFKLIVTYNSNLYTLKSLAEANKLYAEVKADLERK